MYLFPISKKISAALPLISLLLPQTTYPISAPRPTYIHKAFRSHDLLITKIKHISKIYLCRAYILHNHQGIHNSHNSTNMITIPHSTNFPKYTSSN